jgi:hypothetical protein
VPVIESVGDYPSPSILIDGIDDTGADPGRPPAFYGHPPPGRSVRLSTAPVKPPASPMARKLAHGQDCRPGLNRRAARVSIPPNPPTGVAGRPIARETTTALLDPPPCDDTSTADHSRSSGYADCGSAATPCVPSAERTPATGHDRCQRRAVPADPGADVHARPTIPTAARSRLLSVKTPVALDQRNRKS